MESIQRIIQKRAGWALPLLAAALLLYPLHPAFAWLFAMGLLICCLLLSVVPLCCLYILLFCFDPILPFPLLGGSVVRVMQGGLLLRLSWIWLHLHIRPRRGEVIAGILCCISFAIGMTRGLQGDAFSFLVNMGLFLLLRPVMRRQEDLPSVAAQCINAMAWSVLLALLWGICYRRFLAVPVGGLTLLRFMGTYEPNFMAAFANVAWIGMLCLPPRKTWQDTLLPGLLLLCLLLTFSVTAILVLVLVWCLMMLQKEGRKERFLRSVRCLLVAFPLFVCLTLLLPLLPDEASIAGATIAETETVANASQQPAETAVSTDPQDLVLLPEEYAAYRVAGEEAVAYPRPLLLMTPVASLRMDQAEALTGKSNLLMARIEDFLWCIRTGNWDLLSSGRLGLWHEKLKDFAALPLWQQLLGTGPAPTLTYMPLAYTLSYTHNSYLDMMYSFGILGFGLICFYLWRTTRQRRFMGVSLTGTSPGQALFFIRITLLLELCSLTFYLNRVVLFFFL